MNMLHKLADLLEKNGGSDLHLLEGERPHIRVRGELHPVQAKERPLVTREDIEAVLEESLTPDQMRIFKEQMDVDFSVEFHGASGRVNVGLTNGRKYYLVMRFLPSKIIPLEELGLDVEMLTTLADSDEGMVLVTGETSSGKTTTIMAMLDHINRTQRGAITTIENPVEYVLTGDKCLITRRELGRDTPEFKTALRASVRKNPDVLLIGEIRDFETGALAMTAAETGIHVFATLHALGAIPAITRLANILVSEGQSEEDFHLRLSQTLRGIVSQQLVKHADGKNLLPVYEILNVTHAERQYIREMNFGRLEQSIENERNISLGRCLYELWNREPRPIDENTVRRFYSSQFALAMNRMKDKSGYKPLVGEM